MIPLIITSRAIRNEVREYLNLAKDVRDFMRSLWEAVHGERYQDAEEILATHIREQKAGRAAYEASRLAGPGKGKQ